MADHANTNTINQGALMPITSTTIDLSDSLSHLIPPTNYIYQGPILNKAIPVQHCPITDNSPLILNQSEDGSGRYKLRDYQARTLEWMKYRESQPIRGGIISLEKGLGKTLTALYRCLEDRHLGPSLYICKNSLIGEVLEQLEQFFGKESQVRYYVMHESYSKKDPEKFTFERLRHYDLIITTYEMIKKSAKLCKAMERILVYGMHYGRMSVVAYSQPHEGQMSQDYRHYTGYALLHQIRWKHIIVDEAQKMSDPTKQCFRAVASLLGLNKFVLTGDPVRNADRDMWSLLFFCGMTEVKAPKHWKYEIFRDSYTPLIYYISLEQAGIVLPDKREHDYILKPNEMEKAIYKFYFLELWHSYDTFIRDPTGEKQFALIIALFNRLRQICTAPYLITKESKDRDLFSLVKDSKETQWIPKTCQEVELTCLYKASSRLRHLEKEVHDIMVCGFSATKIKRALKIIESVINEPGQNPRYPNKIVIFSSYTSTLHLLAKAFLCKYQKVPDILKMFTIIDGEISGKPRIEMFKRFKKDPQLRILFVNTMLGAEGLNFQIANHVMFMESWWNPVPENQGICRIYRPGQQREVHIHRFIIAGTIETAIDNLCKAKSSIGRSYLDISKEDERMEKPRMDKETLGKILRDAWPQDLDLFNRN